jgi:hypothetical protein
MPEGRQPLRWPFTSREQQQRAQQRAAEAAKSSSESESDEESEGERSKSSAGRVNYEEGESDSGASSRGSPSSAQGDDAARDKVPNQAPASAATEVTADVVAAHYDKMFSPAAAEPMASGLEPCMPRANKRLVSLVSAHVEGLKKADIDVLSRAFGNFDKVVAQGWLVGDLVRGSPLLGKTEAYTIGLKVKYEAGKVAKKEAALKRSYSHVPAADPKRRSLVEAADKEMETLLLESAEIELSAAGSQRKVSRKRARSQEEEEPSHEDVIAGFQEARREATKWVRRAEVELARTTAVVKTKKAVQERMAKKLEGKLTDKQLVRFMGLFRQAHTAHMEALFDERVDAEFLLEMKLQLTEIERDMYLAEWEASLELEAAARARADRNFEIAQRAVRAHRDLIENV